VIIGTQSQYCDEPEGLLWFLKKLSKKKYKRANSLCVDQWSYKYSSKFAHFCNFYFVSRIIIDPQVFQRMCDHNDP